MSLDILLKDLWSDYISIAPIAKEIHDILLEQGEEINNDHIAFRTFSSKGMGIEEMEVFFSAFGYARKGDYSFSEKKLNAIHLEHQSDATYPKIFLSELRYKELSARAQEIIEREITKVKDLSISELFKKKDVFSISSSEYRELLDESEYGAWLCALGFRANHFTILVNTLKKFNNLNELNDLLISKGISLNRAGGLIKGNPDVYLEQSSTMASRIEVKFTDKSETVPSCYYEFALRYSLSSGELYQGFVTNSADKIFESTNDELAK
ncbi:hypothetical protein BIY24_05340 [Halobacteriovorax marinus]|uniref:DUF1338 domain-containing protein n=1 Tax=Halobacteriovorax marinus TaxID=97084 RepID=UPI000BC2D231|nr:DUF1338 domain-containing protein [Halobacteriovorax marinus]ATH07381.1 hypothetical protein BIY24_05340 [Halobacteriovorax marinus]